VDTRILVTGAAGLIGRYAVRVLAERPQTEVIAVARRPLAPDPTPRATCVAHDLTAPDAAAALARLGPTVIVHAAAVLPPRQTGDEAAAAARANRAIDDAAIVAAGTQGCRLIYLSGTSLYGGAATLCDEQAPLRARGPYLEEKLRTEEQLRALGQQATVLRVSSPYAFGQRALTVLVRFVTRATRGEELLYYGTGAREQDFIAAADVADAIRAAIDHTHAHGPINVASGRPVSMRTLAELVVSTLGARSRVRAADQPDPEEDSRVRIDIGRAATELAWRPTTSLEDGIRALAAAARAETPAPGLRA
jgi:nucleoside-diphosphate-sugar epimerase